MLLETQKARVDLVVICYWKHRRPRVGLGCHRLWGYTRRLELGVDVRDCWGCRTSEVFYKQLMLCSLTWQPLELLLLVVVVFVSVVVVVVKLWNLYYY